MVCEPGTDKGTKKYEKYGFSDSVMCRTQLLYMRWKERHGIMVLMEVKIEERRAGRPQRCVTMKQLRLRQASRPRVVQLFVLSCPQTEPTTAVGHSAYVPSENNRRGYNRSLLMFFTSSALRNNVTKLVVRSGSKCGGYYHHMTKKSRKKLTPLTEVAQIPVTIRDRSDDLTVTAELLDGTGSLYLEFSRNWGGDRAYDGQSIEGMKNRTESKHLAVMLVDNLGIQRGYFSSERGVASGPRYLYPEIGTTIYGGSETYGYTIHRFGPRTVGGHWNWNSNKKRFACGEGWRVLALVQDLHKVTRAGTIWVAKKDTTTVYEGACTLR